jgi:cytidylate kinase
MIIAIDGPAASEGTVAKLARPLRLSTPTPIGMRELRCANRHAEAAFYAAETLDPDTLGDPSLRAPGLGEAASQVASHEKVRAALLAYQRAFARRKSGAVLDGRDIGTVIAPDAEVKLFVTATPEIRARRRFLELRANGTLISEQEVLADIRRRDERDMGRSAAPLRKAEDAYLLDTTNLDIDAAFRAAIIVIDAAMGHAGRAL